MHIEFKRIILHNFMSFGDADLKFNDDGFIKVTGINENPLDNAGSNGSGKSSLWEAIIWAITGETIRGTKHVANYYGEDGCFVDIEFYIDETKYQIIRSKDHKVRKTNIQILINGEDVSGKGIRDSEKLLQQYLPDLTASLLGSVIILGQGLPQKFTNNTPSGRKEVLEKLSKSDFMIEDLKKRVSDRKLTLQNELRVYEDNILSNNSNLVFLFTQIEQNNKLLQTLNKDEIEQNIVKYKDELSQITTLLEHNDLSYDDVYSKYNLITTELTNLTSKKTEKLDQITQTYKETILPHSKTAESLKIEYNALNKQLAQMKSIKDVCPTCGQKLPDVHKPDTTQLELELSNVSSKMCEVNDCLISYEQSYNTDINNVKSRYDLEVKQLNTQSQQLNKQLSELKIERQKLSTTQHQLTNSISSEEVKLAQLQATIDNCNKIIRENNENIKIAEDEILYNNKQKDLAQSRLEVISKFDTALKRDFRGYLLSTVITYIQERAKQYCKVIFDTSDIDFCLNGNNIDINYMDRAYENLSGGEKQKIDLIIQFSIRDMLSAQLNFTSNILVLDEVFDGLDMIGCNRVIDMISNLSDVKNVFIVTHRKDLSIPNDKELIVAKSSVGFSEIR